MYPGSLGGSGYSRMYDCSWGDGMKSTRRNAEEMYATTLRSTRFGEVTLAMLLDALSDYTVRYAPEGNAAFSTFIPVAGRDTMPAPDAADGSQSVLYLCHQDLCSELLSHGGGRFVRSSR